jgi:hypothetical protein
VTGRGIPERKAGPLPVAFRERDSGLVRTFKREIMIRFRRGTNQATRARILGKLGLEVRRRNAFVTDQVVAFDASRARSGEVLLDVANECAGLDEVLFAARNFGGTSSATPLAAGIAALVLSANPGLSSDEVRDVLRATADKIGSGYDAQGFSQRFGYGRVNAAKAVAEAKRRASGRRGAVSGKS